jgi:5-methylcytosine-specific restriction endonuclease McrA
MKSDWPDWNVYVRDKCKCVYCGFDGTTSFDTWCSLDIDHLAPKSKYPNIRDEPANKVVACRACNMDKGQYDPVVGQLPVTLNDAWRAELIGRAKVYIANRRSKLQADFELMLSEIRAS